MIESIQGNMSEKQKFTYFNKNIVETIIKLQK